MSVISDVSIGVPRHLKGQYTPEESRLKNCSLIKSVSRKKILFDPPTNIKLCLAAPHCIWIHRSSPGIVVDYAQMMLQVLPRRSNLAISYSCSDFSCIYLFIYLFFHSIPLKSKFRRCQIHMRMACEIVGLEYFFFSLHYFPR